MLKIFSAHYYLIAHNCLHLATNCMTVDCIMVKSEYSYTRFAWSASVHGEEEKEGVNAKKHDD